MSQPQIIENGTVGITDGIITYVGQNCAVKSVMVIIINYWHYKVRGAFIARFCWIRHTHFVFAGEREEFSWRLKGESYMSMQREGVVIAR